MAIIVQKYGGSSVADAEKIQNVADRLVRAKEQGNSVVAVVSAMGKTTDGLIELANQVSTRPNRREMDSLLSTGEIVTATLLTMALRSARHRAISLTGAQAGIKTDASFNRARITDISPKRINEELERGRIVIVAGFQGITEAMDVTTLGRGGSDTTAVGLAIALGADRCEIYTDVEGVYTADPRIVPEARKLEGIDYEEMLESASVGAKVMHSRAVELGWVYNMPILVASSFSDNAGTLIHGGASMEIRNKVSGIAHDPNIAKITVVGVPDQPGIASSIFEPLANAGVSVDSIVQNASVNRITDLTFTIASNDVDNTMQIIKPVAESIGAKECVSDSTLGKVSVIGAGMQTGPGYASRMFRALSDEEINVELISTSEIRITCIIDEEKVPQAVRALHKAFELEAE
ncbi:MAG: aspartate kinase [Chloroflexi bacterium]|nr:aspartate kinase [Chloroflexota bacterium]